MCTDCGCGVTGEPVARFVGQEPEPVLERLLAANDRAARHNREHLDAHEVFCVNLMSSPGAGKTRLLEATIDRLADRVRVAVIEGDLETENDAARIRAHGVPAVQITTGTACHLDAAMIHVALHELDLEAVDLLFVENVGNLVCPASFDLGQHVNVVLLSVPEGDDKPAKYPVMFRAADLVVLTKADFLTLSPEFAPDRVRGYLHDLGSEAAALELSASAGTGMRAWIDWLIDSAAARRGGDRLARGAA